MTEHLFSAEKMQALRDRVGYEDWFLEADYKLAEGELIHEARLSCLRARCLCPSDHWVLPFA